MRYPRRTIAVPLATALAASGLGIAAVATAPAAGAAAVPISNATLRWGINDESNHAAFAPGTWNLMSAGKVGNPGASSTLKTLDSGATWSNGTAANWGNQSGNVTLEDKQADGSYAPATFDGTRTNSAGTPVTVAGDVHAETQLVFRKGTGTVDSAANTASLQWDGDASVLYYSGMSFFYLSDPTLTVEADGDATVTATVDGYGADMNDTSKWVDLTEQQVTLATLKNVDVDDLGFTATPEYRGVEYTAPTGGTAQNRTATDWGSFPQSFVDFQQQTGTGPYFYSTGGAADKRKPTQPLQVSFGLPKVTASQTTVPGTGSTTVTVTGTGFDPSLATGTRPPLAGKPGGAYVVFGKFADVWQPSKGAAGSTRANSSQKWAVRPEDKAALGSAASAAVDLGPDGSFTAELTVDKTAIDTATASSPSLTNYGIYTYAGSGAVAASYETYTPITFTTTTLATDAAGYTGTHGVATPIAVTVSGTGAGSAPTGTVTLAEDGTTLSTATLAGGAATLQLPAGTLPGSHALTVRYGGEPRLASAQRDVTAQVAPGVLSAPAPKVTGTARVGSTLTAVAGSWTPGTALSYQWRRNGAAIAGATRTTYRAVAADAGRSLTVAVTGRKANYTTAVKASAARPVAKGVLAKAKVAIGGKARVGKKLTAKVGSWGVSPVSVRYQWRAAGKVIKGATKRTVTLKKAQRGKKITVVVTAAKTGYTTVSRTSSATARVAR